MKRLDSVYQWTKLRLLRRARLLAGVLWLCVPAACVQAPVDLGPGSSTSVADGLGAGTGAAAGAQSVPPAPTPDASGYPALPDGGIRFQCYTDEQCSDVQHCVYGLCVDCATDAHCPEDRLCLAGRCVECTNANHCSLLYGTERPVCAYATCRPCTRPLDCLAWGGGCNPNGQCESIGCQGPETCPPGWICSAGSCIRECIADWECPPTEFCEQQHCRPRYPMPRP